MTRTAGALGVPAPSLGDGPYIEVGMFAADGNVNWDNFIYNTYTGLGGNAGPYFFGAFSTSVIGSAAQYSRRWWWRDFGPGGIWDVRVLHTKGFDVAIYDFEIDGKVFATLDGWTGGADINNIEATVRTGLRIPPGRHKVSITMRGHNPGATGIPWYPAIQGMMFRRTDRLSGLTGAQGLPSGKPQEAGGQVINLHALFATGNTNWDNYQLTNEMIHNFELYSTGAQNAARWWDLDLVAGYWDLELRVATFSSAGIINVQLDGVTVGTIDTYSASTTYAVKKTLRFLVPKTGTQTLKFLMATKNGSSSQYYGDVSLIQLRQVPPVKTSLPHRIIQFTAAWAHGDTNWNTLFTTSPSGGNAYVYGGDVESTGAQNAERWWYVPLTAGTWAFEMVHSTGANRGIYSVRIDGVEVGTVDGYAGAPGTKSVRSSPVSFTVRGTGEHKLSLVMATKNGSSSNYFGTVTLLSLRRTV